MNNRIQSVATIQEPEFINLQPFNPLISHCEIKVLYLGHNRNGSYITKDVAQKMANTLPGCPIVGAYLEEKEDFGDHGEVITIEDGEIHFSVKTKPYGFVAPDAKVWFKNFIDTDEFGNRVERTYLMTTGYLWTGQFEEAEDVITEGKAQSMELDSETLDGHWAEDNNLHREFFIINDAIFTKLCILGDDVEPCFEGASVTAPEVSKDFTLRNTDFKNTLFAMMNELKYALQNGGGSMDPEITNEEVESKEIFTAEKEVDFTAEETVETAEAETETEFTEEEIVEVIEVPDEEIERMFGSVSDLDAAVENSDEDSISTSSLNEGSEAQDELNSLRAELEELRAFKLQIEDQQKDALIAKYFMLSDDDKAEVIEHKAEYSLEEIESKLALIYVKKNVNFAVEETSEKEISEPEFDLDSPTITFALEDETAGIANPVVQALRNTVHD